MDKIHSSRRIPWALEQELKKAALGRPVWESRNEGIHERVNFSDTIWGFNLAGGAYYNTPLRVTEVKEESRAQHAGIKIGDVLRSINGIETSTLTVQAAHDIILESGLEIKLNITAPDVEETTYYVYQDELEEDQREAKRLRDLKLKNERRKFNGAKTNEAWSIAWPCSKKRDIMYKESNCYLVPSAYTAKHPNKIRGPNTNNGTDKDTITTDHKINEEIPENGNKTNTNNTIIELNAENGTENITINKIDEINNKNETENITNNNNFDEDTTKTRTEYIINDEITVEDTKNETDNGTSNKDDKKTIENAIENITNIGEDTSEKETENIVNIDEKATENETEKITHNNIVESITRNETENITNNGEETTENFTENKTNIDEVTNKNAYENIANVEN